MKVALKKRIPRLSLIIFMLLAGAVGTYTLLSSFAATPVPPAGKIYGVDNTVGWGQSSQASQQLGVNGDRLCQDDIDFSAGALVSLASAGMRMTECVNSYEGLTSLNQHAQDYANLVASQARTYGPGGTYWASHSQYSAYAIQSFELMNEPYGWWYRNGDNDPASYAHIIAAAIRAGHAANPQAKFYIPLAPGDVKLANGSWVDWNQAMLQAEPDLFTLADGFSIHIYDTPTNFATTLDQRKDWAWSQTGGNGKPFIITEANLTDQQASPEADYASAIPQFVQIAHDRDWVKELFIFCWHGFSGRDYLGFLDMNGNPRQDRIDAYHTAIQQAQASIPTPPADTTKPAASLTSPAAGATVSGQVPLTATASDNVAVSKVEFYADGTLIGTDTSAPYTATWDATSAVAGSHTISVKAYDAAGNIGTDNKTVMIQAPVASQLVTSQGFESGDLDGWNIAGVGDAVPAVVSDITRNGSKSARFVLTGNQGRSELILGGNGSASTAGTYSFKEGDDYYYAFSIYIVSMTYGQPGGHNVIFQLKGDDQQSPALALQLWNSPAAASDGTPGGKGLWYSGSTLGSDRFLSPLSEQQWHDIVVHFKVSNKNAGSDQIYLDGKLLRTDTSANTMASDASSTYIKDGIYRNGATVVGTSDIRIDDAKLGTSYAAVAEPASVTPPPADTTKPTVSFTSPANNSAISGTVTATAYASDDTGVTKVEFSLDGSLKMTDTASPYNYSFDSKALANGSHTLTAKAYDAAGNTTSSTITVNVSNADTTPPSTPASLKATASNATTVNLTWNASTDSGTGATGVVKYNVLRDDVVIAQPTTTSYTDTGRTANTTYSYTVQAVDGAANVSASSAEATVITPGTVDTTPPGVPAALKARPISTTQVNLNWSASSDTGGSGLAGYNVYRNGAKLNNALVTSTSYGDTSVAENTVYSYQVEAVDGSGNKSAKTASVSVTTLKSERGDVTGPNGTPDGKIDLQDVSYEIRNYNTGNTAGDVTGPNGTPDGKVDIYDLSYIIRNYGK